MSSLADYDIKILLSLHKALEGNKKFFKWLLANGYPELSAWSNAVRGDLDALHWLFDNGFGTLGLLSNAIDGEPKAVLLVERSQDEFLIHFSAACRKDPTSFEWLREKELNIFISMAQVIIEILATQAKERTFPYRKQF